MSPYDDGYVSLILFLYASLRPLLPSLTLLHFIAPPAH